MIWFFMASAWQGYRPGGNTLETSVHEAKTNIQCPVGKWLLGGEAVLH